MKKFLALVLALVMTMSLVTISAGAEDFTDDSKITYEEAVDVMTAIGVVGGYADGSFNPTAGLTRGAAAKIICNMLLGPTTAEALVANDAPFADVAVDNVFAGYIAYCVNEGIISGYADGTFKPAAPLTGYAFMKMLLGALGYDAAIEGYTGTNWSIQVAKRALAIGLDDGLVTDFSGAKSLTREEACLYAFNALNTCMVEYDSKSTISVGDIVISQNSDAKKVWDVTNTDEHLFREEFFTNLKATGTPTTDDFKRPATTWFVGKAQTTDNTVGTYTTEADYTVVAKEAYTNAAAAYVDLIDEDFVGATDAAFVNGSTLNVTTGAIATGDVVEYYMADDGDIAKAVVTRYSIAKIDDISTSLTKAQKEDGNTCKVTLKLGTSTVGTILDGDFAGFDADTYTEGTYVLYVKSSNEIWASKVAESVEGKVDAIKGGEARIDGVYYVDTTSSVAKNDEGTFYLNEAGQIMYEVAKADESDNYAYIYSVKKATGANADGLSGDTYTVYAVLADGTKASYVVDTDSVATVISGLDFTSASVVAANKLFAYSVDEDGQFVVETAADNLATVASYRGAVNKDGVEVRTANNGLCAIRATSTTQFIFVDIDNVTDKTVEVATAVGYKNVNIGGNTTRYAVYDDDGYALFVFVETTNDGVTSDALMAVIVDADPVETRVDNVNYYEYTVAVEGVETTLTFKTTDQLNGMLAGTVFEYKMDGEYVKASSVTTSNVNASTVSVVNDDYVVLANGYRFELGDETLYTVTAEYKDFSVAPVVGTDAAETIVVSVGGSYVKDAVVYYTVDAADNNAVVDVFVVDVIW